MTWLADRFQAILKPMLKRNKGIIWSLSRGVSAFIFLGILGLFFVPIILGATSPWSQTDWSGGSGQTSWFNNTKFSSSSDIETSTVGQLQLSTQPEKFTNTGFETNTTGWAQSGSDYGNETLGIASSNISSYWKLNETSGSTVVDSGTHDADGSYSNITLNSSTGVDGQPVGYWNGTSSYANVYSTNLNSNFSGTEGSLSFWFRAEDASVFTDVRNYYLLGITSDSGDQIYIRKQFNSTTNLLFNYRAGGADNFFQQPIASPTSWNHIAITWSDSADQMKIYLNGGLLTTDTSFGTWTGNLTATGSVIGSINTTPTTPWRGNIANFAIWNTPLTPSQVTSLYTYNNLTITRDTVTTYGSSAGSAKIVAGDAGNFVQTVNVGDTSTYVLQAYAYTSGAAVTSSDAELFYNGTTISTTYTNLGGGWYKLSGTLTGAATNREYGVQVKAGKTVYLDNLSLNAGYISAGTLTSSIFDAENLGGWGTLTYATDGVQTASVKVRTASASDMSGATAFSSCTAISSGTDVSSNSCVSDSQRYVQYQVSLSTADATQTPVFTDISLSFTPGVSSSTTYYVDATTGSDSNNGTSTATPWQTIDNVNIAIDSGVVEPGDTVYFKRGETFAGSLDVDISGASGAVITFGAYGSGNKPIINASSNVSAIDLTGRSYITIDNLNLKNATTQAVYLLSGGSNINITNTDIDNTINGYYINTGTFSNITIQTSIITNTTYGLRVANTTQVSDLTIDGVTSNSGTNGILMANAGTFTDVSISDSTFSNNTGAGLSITGVHTNLSLDNVTANSNTLQGFLFTAVTGTTNLTVTDSTFNQNTDIGLQMTGTGDGASITNTTTNSNLWDGVNLKDNWENVVFDNCTSNSNGVDGIGGDGDGFTAHENVSVTIKNSVARNNLQGNISFVDNSSARLEYNEFTLATASTRGSVWVTGTGDHWIYNNVIYNASQNGYGVEIGNLNAKTVTVKNNIVYGFQYGVFQDSPYASTVVEDYNIIYNYGVNDRNGFTEGSNTLNVDPLFTTTGSLFTLQTTSPAIDAGTNVGLSYDHIGTVVPQGENPDIGAYEHDDTAPSISSISASSSSNEATITWVTNENSSSIVDYGSTSSYGTTTTEADTSPRVTSHTVTLTGLSSCSTYHYRVRSKDPTGNEGASTNNTFSTSGCSTTTSAPTNPGLSTPSAPSCTALAPSFAPWLYGAIAQDGNSIMLYFTDASDPVDSYAIEFGTSSGNYQWGAINIGGKGLRTYLVQSLLPNTTYYFRVRGGNGCATGAWSNEISAKTKGLVSFNQFAFTDSELESAPLTTDEEVVPEPSSCQTYTVQSGDSLWSIAESKLGDGNRYKEIIEQNKEAYLSLNTSNSVNAGWELQLDCKQSSQDDKTVSQEEAALESYIVNVNVFGKDQSPVGGARVTIHSDPQEAVTDENGTVRFENVEPGEHRVLVAYNGYEGEQSIFLTGDTKEFTLNITLEMKNVLMSRLFMAIVGGMGAIIAVLTFFFLRANFKKV